MIQRSIITAIDDNNVTHKGNSCSDHQSRSENIITSSIIKHGLYLIYDTEQMCHFNKAISSLMRKVTIIETFIKYITGRDNRLFYFMKGKRLPRILKAKHYKSVTTPHI
jgi:hypothetical protein